ncbi:MAG: monofunctional biosynthetic peptidoglycan transglycosylase [Chthoniobacterales bacterium]
MARQLRNFWVRLLLLVFFIVFVGPVVEVLFVRFFDPPVTTLMVVRKLEGSFSKKYHGDIRYRWISLRDVPKDFLDAVWQMEDSRFFNHDGFDWIEVEEAVERAKRRSQPVRGVSTISMQCARSLFLWEGRSWIRKGIEAYYTFLMEHLLSKQRILELYVNVIELGDGVYGIEEGAEHYYHVSAKELNRPQCAMLAAILPYPRGWDPHNPSPRLRARYTIVLRRMNQGGSIERKLDE